MIDHALNVQHIFASLPPLHRLAHGFGPARRVGWLWGTQMHEGQGREELSVIPQPLWEPLLQQGLCGLVGSLLQGTCLGWAVW